MAYNGDYGYTRNAGVGQSDLTPDEAYANYNTDLLMILSMAQAPDVTEDMKADALANVGILDYEILSDRRRGAVVHWYRPYNEHMDIHLEFDPSRLMDFAPHFGVTTWSEIAFPVIEAVGQAARLKETGSLGKRGMVPTLEVWDAMKEFERYEAARCKQRKSPKPEIMGRVRPIAKDHTYYLSPHSRTLRFENRTHCDPNVVFERDEPIYALAATDLQDDPVFTDSISVIEDFVANPPKGAQARRLSKKRFLPIIDDTTDEPWIYRVYVYMPGTTPALRHHAGYPWISKERYAELTGEASSSSRARRSATTADDFF